MNRRERRAAEKQSRPASSGISPAAQANFAEALRRHQAGSLADAERLYRQVLAFNPRHADSLQLLGVIAHQTGRHSQAVDLIRQAIGINPAAAPFHANLANVLREQGQIAEAIVCYRKVLALKPDDVDTHNNLGVALQELGQLEEALASYRKALALEPGEPGTLNNVAVVLQRLGRPDEAIASYRQARALQPNRPETHANLGDALRQQGRLEEAIDACRRALALRPDYPEALNHLGRALADQRDWGAAAAAFARAVELKPHFAVAHNNLASALVAQGQPEAAIAAYRKAIASQPAYPDAYANLGNALRRAGQLDDAIAACRRGIELSPNLPEAHNNLAMALLLRGDLTAGWPEYEWRREVPGLIEPRRDFAQPQWHGESAAGRTLLVHAEQGLGDTLQFCRYAPLAAARGLRVILQVPKPLVRLLRLLPGVTVIAAGEQLPAFDLHCPLLSMPLAFNTGITNVPRAVPYLVAEPNRVAAWRRRLPAGRYRIGIAWQGNPAHIEDRDRSAALRHFEPLTKMPGVCLISLQKQYGLEQLADLPAGMRVATLGDDFDAGPDAFIDSAAVMESLDLVISSDTSIVHLAGALGRPVWLALSAVPEWRWLMRQGDSPWYPTMRLFRQQARGDWGGVFAAMAERLAETWRG